MPGGIDRYVVRKPLVLNEGGNLVVTTNNLDTTGVLQFLHDHQRRGGAVAMRQTRLRLQVRGTLFPPRLHQAQVFVLMTALTGAHARRVDHRRRGGSSGRHFQSVGRGQRICLLPPRPFWRGEGRLWDLPLLGGRPQDGGRSVALHWLVQRHSLAGQRSGACFLLNFLFVLNLIWPPYGLRISHNLLHINFIVSTKRWPHYDKFLP